MCQCASDVLLSYSLHMSPLCPAVSLPHEWCLSTPYLIVEYDLPPDPSHELQCFKVVAGQAGTPRHHQQRGLSYMPCAGEGTGHQAGFTVEGLRHRAV